MNDTNRSETEISAHRFLLTLLRAKNGAERGAITSWAFNKAHFFFNGAAWAYARGYVQKGTTNASARAWSRFAADSLYLTPAGRAWLRSFGSDYGSGQLMTEQSELARVQAAAADAERHANEIRARMVDVSLTLLALNPVASA